MCRCYGTAKRTSCAEIEIHGKISLEVEYKGRFGNGGRVGMEGRGSFRAAWLNAGGFYDVDSSVAQVEWT